MDSSENQLYPHSFDPDGVGCTGGSIFGLPFTPQQATVVIIPVPWDVTVSSHDGTSEGPANILEQSPQIDLYDEMVKDPWKAGIAMEDISGDLLNQNRALRQKARRYISALEQNSENQFQAEFISIREEINTACKALADSIQDRSRSYLNHKKLVVLIGGDHSTPLGLIQAVADHHDAFGILHIDAHADLRDAYMGFSHSHASIMHNALKMPAVKQLLQVGLRDVSAGEVAMIKDNPGRLHAFFARDIHRREFNGESWRAICDDILSRLPQKVYISFDIDGLDPSQCPSTGTPVPGGLDYSRVLFLFEQLVESGRTIVGFDLVETGPNPMDGIIACRILYKTIALMLKSNYLA